MKFFITNLTTFFVAGLSCLVSVQSQEAVESGNTDTSDVRNASGTVQPSTSASPSSDLSVKTEPANRSRIEDKAKSLVKKLSTVPSSEKAQGIIRELFDLDASKDVKQQGRKTALSKLASLAEKDGKLEEAQQYLAEYVKRYPEDALIPILFLRQGNLYRKMGAYDLERSKYYDAINSVPRVTLDNNDYNIDYIKRAGFIARVRIAESFFDEAKNMPPTLAGSNYSNAVEMFQKLLDEGGEGEEIRVDRRDRQDAGGEGDDIEDKEIRSVDLSLKLIRASYELSNSMKLVNAGGASEESENVKNEYKKVRDKGLAFEAEFNDSHPEQTGEVLYYVLKSILNLDSQSPKILGVFYRLISLGEKSDNVGKKAYPWILKGTVEIGQYFFLKKENEKAIKVLEKQLELVTGGEDGAERLFATLYGLKYAEELIDKKIAEKRPLQDAVDISGPIVNRVNSEAKELGLEMPSLTNYKSISNETDLKGEVGESIEYLESQLKKRYRAVLPVIYKLGLCRENLKSEDLVGVFERIPAGILRVKVLKGEIDDREYFETSDKSTKFHVVKSLDQQLYPGAVLVCHWGGAVAKGSVVRSKDGGTELEIESVLTLNELLEQEYVGDGSLALRLIRDMAIWRVNNLFWLSEFDTKLHEIQ